MSTPESKIVVAIETLLRGMPKASRDLATFEKRLRALQDIKIAPKPISTTQIDKAALAAQRLQQQQQRLSIAAQELANRQERARQAADRLAKSQERLAQQSAKATRGLSANADAHVKAFRAIETGAKRNKAEVDKINADTARQAKEQARIQEQSAKVIAQTQVANAKAGANALIDSLNKSSLAGDRLEKILTRVGATLNRIGAGLASFGRTLTVALTAPLAALGAVSIKSASDLDAQINTLRAFTGSSEAAERRLSELIATAQRTPGLTTQLGLMLDAQLRLANVTVETIDKVAPAIGRLNAVQKLQDPSRFAQNLVQLVTQNFERIDLKELVGQSPVAGQLIKEIFNVDSPINAEAIRASAKRLGLTTTDAFFAAFAEAASRNQALSTVTESIATRFSKFMDRVTLALRPLGLAIVNALTPIADFVVPIIERLSRAFASMPAPVQLVIVAFGALAAAAGPLILITGHLISGVGTLITAYARLVALGLTPTIKGFQLLGQVMRGTAALTAGQAATTAAASAGWIALGGAIAAGVAILAIAAVALANYATEQEKAVDIDKDAAAARLKRIPQLKAEIAELTDLANQTKASAEQQERLAASYESLDREARGRISLIESETDRLKALIAEKQKQLQLDEFSSNATSLQLINNLTIAINNLREAEAEHAAAKAKFDAVAFRESIKSLSATEQAVRLQQRQRQASLDAAAALEKISQRGAEVDAAVQVIKALADASGVSAEQLLRQAEAAGANATAVDHARRAIQNLIPEQEELAIVVAEANKELIAQNEALEALENDATVVVAKSADKALKSVLEFIKANTTSTEDARRALQNYIQLFPQLEKAVERAGGIDAVIDSLTKKSTKKSETGLRNAREQLANALLRIAEAEIEQRNTAERLGNERLLRANENAHRLQLIAYRDYLKARAQLTEDNLKLEIQREALIATNARQAQVRLLAAAQKSGIPQAERVKRQAQAAAEEEKAIQAETRLKELEEQRAVIIDELRQLFAEAQKEQIDAVTKLQIEYAELTGRIEDALDAATVDKFREALLQLGKQQESINKDLEKARKKKDADAIAELEKAARINQAQIDLIEGIEAQERATNQLIPAQRLIENAKAKQAELERQIAFDVEFRGLKEDEAIKRRLEGERKLADSLILARDLIQDQIDAMNARALPVPQALLDFIREMNAAVAGLGELPFSEQFRLAQQEFDRINDERIQKIQDVERAVRNRDIAEAEGAILIRKINGQYIGDLEKQLALLKQIAAASGNRTLQQQAQSTAETVKDAKDEVASLGKQIESAGKDAARSGFTDFFKSVLSRTADAKTAILDLLDSVVDRINDVIAENLSKALFESIFGGAEGASGGILERIRNAFGGGGKGASGGIGGVAAGAVQGTATVEAAAAGTALTTGATAAATALTTGGTAAATALTTGGASAGTTLLSSVTAAATAFAATISAAGATFAAVVGAASSSQAIGGLGASIPGAAKGSIFTPKPGGQLAIVAEGGYPEAVLTTDPKHAARQYEILKHYLKQTRGLFGRIPQQVIPRFETGAFISPRQTEINLLSSITRGPSPVSVLPDAALASASSKQARGLRIILVKDMREVRDYINSAEGEQVIVERLGRNSTFKTMVRG